MSFYGELEYSPLKALKTLLISKHDGPLIEGVGYGNQHNLGSGMVWRLDVS